MNYRKKFIRYVLWTVVLIVLGSLQLAYKNQIVPPIGYLFSPFTGMWVHADYYREPSYSAPPGDSLRARVDVFYDERAVPHIFADNDMDAYFMQGYITASQRLWQMDFLARVGEGRLTETFSRSKQTLASDTKVRRLRLVASAKASVELWKKDTAMYKNMTEYARGVNAFMESLDSRSLPLEFKILGYRPDQWTPLRSALILKNMSVTLAGDMPDLGATNTKKILGEELFDFLFTRRADDGTPVIPNVTGTWGFSRTWGKSAAVDSTWLPSVDTATALSPILSDVYMPRTDYMYGSNNWAISGKRTTSGNAILCNDPHLGLSLPSVWFENQLIVADEMNVYGASLPGVPGVVIGFNEYIAWGMTNSEHDLADTYSIRWKDSKKLEYLYDGKYVPVTIILDTVKNRVANAIRSRIDTIRVTEWGPVYYYNPKSLYNDYAVQWACTDPSNEPLVIYKLNHARNLPEFQHAIEGFTCPAQNIVFAGRKNKRTKEYGDIGMWLQGRLPNKLVSQGTLVQNGTNPANKWRGYIPTEHLPHIVNPETGYVVSANQATTDQTYPYPYNGYFEHFRGRTIHAILDTMEQLNPAKMKLVQTDDYSLEAAEVLPLLAYYTDTSCIDAKYKNYYARLSEWDYHFNRDSLSPTLFRLWWQEIQDKIWNDDLTNPDDLKTKLQTPFLRPSTWATAQLIQYYPNHPIFDIKGTKDRETIDFICQFSFKIACEKLTEWLDINNRLMMSRQAQAKEIGAWGDFKATSITHLSQLKAFGDYRINASGASHCINALDKNDGPSFRMIVEVGDTMNAYVVYPGGQAGNPGSYFYNNFVEQWSNNLYYKVFYMKSPNDKIRNEVSRMQVIIPPKRTQKSFLQKIRSRLKI